MWLGLSLRIGQPTEILMTLKRLDSAIEHLISNYFHTTFKKGGNDYKRKVARLGNKFAIEFEYKPQCCEHMSVRPTAVLILMIIKKKLLEGSAVFDGKMELSRKIHRSSIIISDIYIWLKIKRFITLDRLLPVNKYRKMNGIVSITPMGDRLIECSLKVCDNLMKKHRCINVKNE